jgi:hypothetical protein
MGELLQHRQIVALQKIGQLADLTGKPGHEFRDNFHDPQIVNMTALDSIRLNDGVGTDNAVGTASFAGWSRRPDACSGAIGAQGRTSIAEVLMDDFQQSLLIYGLAQVTAASAGHTFFAVFRHGIRRQRDDR